MPQPRKSRRTGFHGELVAPRLVTTGLALVTIVLALSVGVGARGSGPKQPIDSFSHKIHAGVNQIQCLHCHAGTDRSQLAGVPATSVCVGCHLYLMNVKEKPGVKQLFEYWEKQESIPWARVYYLPQFAQFKHHPHVRAGLDCQTCHGPVQEMDVVSLNQDLKMNWCIGCHRNTQGTTAKVSSALRANIASAPTDCATCHY